MKCLRCDRIRRGGDSVVACAVRRYGEYWIGKRGIGGGVERGFGRLAVGRDRRRK